MAKPRVMYFNNDRHSLAYMYEPPMHKEEWESAVDELVGTPVEALMYCLGDGRTVMHDSEVGELLGENQDRWENLVVRRAHQNPKHLIEEGNDPLRITVEHAHANGLLLYPMFIVQFGMSSHPERVSTFRLENRHLEIGASEDIGPDYPGAEYLDFKYREVRDERFALIEETVNKYAVDGFQLNLGPYPYYFHPKEMEEGRKTMTEWVRRVYEVVKKSGPDRELVIDVPMSIEGSFSVGLDVGEWIRQGIVDVLIGAPRLYRGLADYRPLVEAAKGSDCRIHADIGSTVDSDRLGDATIEMMRAEVTNY